ncbi:MAG: hypothetical protein C4575_10480 [Desulforudis sp.]|nr:MAG: hypothetical protein C4575_10480 [Desulforudis sp.]
MILLLMFLMTPLWASAASGDNGQLSFTGEVFSEREAMKAFFGNVEARQDDSVLSLLIPGGGPTYLYSRWKREEYCTPENIRKYGYLGDGQYRTFLDNLGWYHDVYSWEVLRFQVQGVEKAFQITQSETCDAQPCYAAIGVFLWTRDGKGWRLEKAAPCLTGMGIYGSSHAQSELVRTGQANYGILFTSTFDDLVIATVVLVDEQGHLRVVFNDTVGDGNNYVSAGMDEGIPEGQHYQYWGNISFEPGKNKKYWDMLVRYEGTRLKYENRGYGKGQKVIPYNLRKRYVYSQGRYR